MAYYIRLSLKIVANTQKCTFETSHLPAFMYFLNHIRGDEVKLVLDYKHLSKY